MKQCDTYWTKYPQKSLNKSKSGKNWMCQLIQNLERNKANSVADCAKDAIGLFLQEKHCSTKINIKDFFVHKKNCAVWTRFTCFMSLLQRKRKGTFLVADLLTKVHVSSVLIHIQCLSVSSTGVDQEWFIETFWRWNCCREKIKVDGVKNLIKLAEGEWYKRRK